MFTRAFAVVVLILSVAVFAAAQQQFAFRAPGSEADGLTSRSQLNIFTYYDDFPTKRAARYLISLSEEPGLVIGGQLFFGAVPGGDSGGLVEANDDAMRIAYLGPTGTYVNDSVGSFRLGWNNIGNESVSVSLGAEYSQSGELLDALIAQSGVRTSVGRSYASVTIQETLKLGVDVNDRYGDFSLSGTAGLLRYPESWSNLQATLFDGAVTLFDASLTKLLTTFNVTDESIGYTGINLFTPVPLVPFVFYDRFAGDDHSYLTPVFSTFPLVGADLQFSPTFRLHDKRVQSTEVAFDILSLFRADSWDGPYDRNNPPFRHRDSGGSYDSIGTIAIGYRRQYYDRYTGEPSDAHIVTLDQAIYARDLAGRMARGGHGTEYDPADIFVGMSLRYDFTNEWFEYLLSYTYIY